MLSAGAGQTLAVTFTPSDSTNYNPATATVTINVNPGSVVTTTPTITWADPADITAGTFPGASQLAATFASVAGVFTYSPANGTVLGAGAGQTLAVTFTPSDTTHYNPATATVTINVNPGSVVKTTPTLTWANPARHHGRDALGASQLAATASVAGRLHLLARGMAPCQRPVPARHWR